MEQQLSQLLGRELKLARDQEFLKEDMESRYDYHIATLYYSIDDTNYGYIDNANLKRFFIKCGQSTSEKL